MIAARKTDRKLTIADLAQRFGPMPFARIARDPPPGTGTAEDVLTALKREDRLCELIDGVLVEKVMGYEESLLAAKIIALLQAFVEPRRLGRVAGEGGILRLTNGRVRIPDVSFVSRARLPSGKGRRRPIPDLVPNLAVEVLSEGNTEQEMAEKLDDYFDTGVELVWFFYPVTRQVVAYSSRKKCAVLKGAQTLTGGRVLRGFKVKVADVFTVLDDL